MATNKTTPTSTLPNHGLLGVPELTPVGIALVLGETLREVAQQDQAARDFNAQLPLSGTQSAPIALPAAPVPAPAAAPRVHHVPGPALQARVRAGKKVLSVGERLLKMCAQARRKNNAAANKVAHQGNNGATAVYHDARLSSHF